MTVISANFCQWNSAPAPINSSLIVTTGVRFIQQTPVCTLPWSIVGSDTKRKSLHISTWPKKSSDGKRGRKEASRMMSAFGSATTTPTLPTLTRRMLPARAHTIVGTVRARLSGFSVWVLVRARAFRAFRVFRAFPSIFGLDMTQNEFQHVYLEYVSLRTSFFEIRGHNSHLNLGHYFMEM